MLLTVVDDIGVGGGWWVMTIVFMVVSVNRVGGNGQRQRCGSVDGGWGKRMQWVWLNVKKKR